LVLEHCSDKSELVLIAEIFQNSGRQGSTVQIRAGSLFFKAPIKRKVDCQGNLGFLTPCRFILFKIMHQLEK
jgi:hypothetical protein